jgi:2-polyprenyl-3-methyl-5-hydroxy-6-metoxy-1,4-benzoquinol methylase
MKEFIEQCNICKNKNFNYLKSYKKDYLYECNNCSFAFSTKIPTDKELEEVYKNYDRNVKLSDDSIKNIYKIVNWQIKNFKFNNVLDIGCGNGDYLDAYKEKGIKTYFTEFEDEDLISYLKKNHEYIDGGMFPVSSKKFDLITLTELIEHTNNPNEIIENLYNLQNKGGLIYITTPNYESLEKKLYKQNYTIFRYPEHLSYFTVKTLDKLLTQNNYKKIYNYSDNFSLFRLLDLMISKKIINVNPNKVSDNTQFIAKRTGLIFIKNIVSKILQFFNLGNNIKAIYIKN